VNVIIGCEFSGIVRDAFIERGHDAISVDLLDSERPGPNHIVGDLFSFLSRSRVKWDLMIFFWPCTNMAVSGARWFHLKRKEQARDVAAFKRLMEWPIPRVAGENPIGVLSTLYRKPDQILQPWMFGHGETKATCIWKKGLPDLKPTNIVSGRHGRVWREAPSPDRWKNRSRTLPGLAEAFAEQWGGQP